MPIKDYGVWVGYPISFFAETDEDTPHLQLRFGEDPEATEGSIRAAINIKSSTAEESRLVYWFARNFDHPITENLDSLGPGFHRRSDGAPALDYIRGNLFSIKSGSILAHNVPGEKNDIIDYVSPILTQAIYQKATIYIFGEQFSRGESGIHNVHMNQGNSGRFERFNGTWQDGGILLRFPDGHWEGIFLAFGVQKVHTDDKGNPVGNEDFVKLLETDSGPEEGSSRPGSVPDGQGSGAPIFESSIFIRAALLNPIGPDQNTANDSETVYLFNRSTRQVDVTRYSIMNRSRSRQPLVGFIAGQSSRGFLVPEAPLSNKGGTITLLDYNGLKVDGVSYTKAQAEREGQLVYFT